MLNLVRSMTFACALPLQFWGDAVQYAVHIFNRSLTRSNEKKASTIEVLTGKASDLRRVASTATRARYRCNSDLRQASL